MNNAKLLRKVDDQAAGPWNEQTKERANGWNEKTTYMCVPLVFFACQLLAYFICRGIVLYKNNVTIIEVQLL